jgi:Predicted transcriptional regulators
MNITINENLKKLRHDKGNTQEELANYLGISFQAVSKWERGDGYPDITLLPQIAAYYGISSDDLLGIGKMAQRKKIDEYWQKASELEKVGDKEKVAEVWKNALREFPNVLEVIYAHARTLPDGEEKIRANERLIRESTEDDDYYYSGVQALCYAYKSLGDIEKAKQYARRLPIYYVTENQIMMGLLKGEEAVNHIQYNIMMLTDLIWLNVINLAREGDFTPREKIYMHEYVISLYRLMFDGEDFGYYYDRTTEMYCRISLNYALLKDEENTLKNLEASVEHTIKYITMAPGKYTSPLTNRNGYDSVRPHHAQSAISWLLGETASPEFDFCRNNPRFTAVVDGLKSHQS